MREWLISLAVFTEPVGDLLIRTTKHIGGDIHAFEVKRGEGRHGIFQLIDGWIKIICQQDPIAYLFNE